MNSYRRLRLLIETVAMAAVICGLTSRAALASSFTLSPVRVFLSRTTHSETLTLRNESDQPISFQVSASEWHQNPDGSMALSPTDDVVFFPVLLKLKPGEARNLRVGVTVPPAPIEKTYRLFVEELAEPRNAEAGAAPSVRFLTKMGVPIFVEPTLVEPPSPDSTGQINNITVAGGKLSFDIANRGNRHFVVQKLIVHGDGAVPFRREVNGWYVLAGENRSYNFDIPKSDCLRLHQLSIEVQTENSSFSGSSAVDAAACSPAPARQQVSASP